MSPAGFFAEDGWYESKEAAQEAALELFGIVKESWSEKYLQSLSSIILTKDFVLCLVLMNLSFTVSIEVPKNLLVNIEISIEIRN